MWYNGIMAGCYTERNADLSTSSQRKAQLLKNQNMLSVTHLSSRKCPDSEYITMVIAPAKLPCLRWAPTSEARVSIGSISWSLGGWNHGLYVRGNQRGNWRKHLAGDVTLSVRESFVLLLGIYLKGSDALNWSAVLRVEANAYLTAGRQRCKHKVELDTNVHKRYI